MNGAPDWQDGECCFRCRTQFTLVARKHHCRNCGNIFCAKCSSQQIPLPKLNIEKNVRVCDGCFEKLSGEKDPLDLALDKTSENSDSVKASKSNSKTSGQSKSKSSNTKPQPASAPSEQDLKEEEDLQLALALSLSETPAKVSFPDMRQFEDPPVVKMPVSQSNHFDQVSSNSKNTVASSKSTTTPSFPTVTESVPSYSNVNFSDQQRQPQQTQQPQQHQQQMQEPQPNQTVQPTDYPVQEQDRELFRFVAEVQSTSEVFTNRINSNKLRNRPIADDSAIQTLFLKLTTMHTKLLDYIKTHDQERAVFETIQDKLSQIADARAALDALREEHQEKIRQEAAEAERLRQSQLASKLEMMRQKKSQMMQYQREIALQRIQAQEMMLRQPAQGYQGPPATSVPQQVLQTPPVTTAITTMAIHHPPRVPEQPQIDQQHQPVFQHAQMVQQTTVPQQALNHNHTQQNPNSIQQDPYQQHVQQLGDQQQQQLHHFIPHVAAPPVSQPLPSVPKVEDDEAPLISFDD